MRAGTPDALSDIRLFVCHGHQGDGAPGGRRYLSPFGAPGGTEVPVPHFAGKMGRGYVKIN